MKFEKVGQDIGKLVDKKNAEYGSSFEKVDQIMAILYPNGISVPQLKNASILVRILDKVVRVANGNQGDENAFNDLAGYGILMSAEPTKKGIFSKGDK